MTIKSIIIVFESFVPKLKIKLLYSLQYAEACNEFAGVHLRVIVFGNTTPLKKCRSGGERFATLPPIWLTGDLKLNLTIILTIFKNKLMYYRLTSGQKPFV